MLVQGKSSLGNRKAFTHPGEFPMVWADLRLGSPEPYLCRGCGAGMLTLAKKATIYVG